MSVHSQPNAPNISPIFDMSTWKYLKNVEITNDAPMGRPSSPTAIFRRPIPHRAAGPSVRKGCAQQKKGAHVSEDERQLWAYKSQTRVKG